MATVDTARRVDVRVLVGRAGAHLDVEMPVQWTDGTSIRVRLARRGEAGWLALAWSLRGQPFTFAARLETTAQKLGGRRWWVLCPRCERRCAVLVLTTEADGVGCRVCLRLLYQSQLVGHRGGRRRVQGPHDHAFDMAEKIRRRYGGPASVFEPFDRPKGMHRTTWARVSERERDYRLAGFRQVQRWLDALKLDLAHSKRSVSRTCAPAHIRPK